MGKASCRSSYLGERVNASPSLIEPPGWDPEAFEAICGEVWQRALSLVGGTGESVPSSRGDR